MELRFDKIEQQLADALPELKVAADYYWKVEGSPGADCGPYLFFEDMFGCYVEILLAMDSSPTRDRLIQRAFGFVEQMLAARGDHNVRDLAYIGLYEGKGEWWLRRAQSFIGPLGREALNADRPGWQDSSAREPCADGGSDFADSWGVRDVIARELSADGLTLSDIPGKTLLEANAEQMERADAENRRGSS